MIIVVSDEYLQSGPLYAQSNCKLRCKDDQLMLFLDRRQRVEDISRKGRKGQAETGLQGKNGAYGTQLQNTIGRYSQCLLFSETCRELFDFTMVYHQGQKILLRGWTYYLSQY